MRFFLTITLILTSFLVVGQNDSLAMDSMAHHEVRMDSNALWALDQRLAKFESDHVLFAQSTSPLVDTINPLPLNDSIFKYYMADLDTRTPFEMTYNPVVKKYLQRYLKFGTTRLSRMMAHGQYYFPMFEEHLDKYDMPLEIKYLAVIESALNPKAKSKMARKRKTCRTEIKHRRRSGRPFPRSLKLLNSETKLAVVQRHRLLIDVIDIPVALLLSPETVDIVILAEIQIRNLNYITANTT